MTTTNTPYQVLASLRPEEMDALRDDIAQRGVPVEIDDAGNVLDGHRVAIAEKLGIRYRKVVRAFDSDDDNVEHALKMNLLRRLGPVAWAEAFRKLCRVRGVRLGSGAQKRNGKVTQGKTATIAVLAGELGAVPRTARWRPRLADELKGHGDLREADDNWSSLVGGPPLSSGYRNRTGNTGDVRESLLMPTRRATKSCQGRPSP